MFYYLRYKNNNSKLQLSFKNRSKSPNKCYNGMILGNYKKIVSYREFLFYFVYFKLLRKGLKNLYGKSYMLKKYINIYMSIMTNFPISNKSKNSRMGKGKGSLVSWASRLKSGHIVFFFNGVSNTNIYKFYLHINKVLPNTFVYKPTIKNNLLYV